MIKILKASGLSFAVMQEESCNAELARRVGEEYLFECRDFDEYRKSKKVHIQQNCCALPLTASNTLKNDSGIGEGGKFNVISHVRFIAEQLMLAVCL